MSEQMKMPKLTLSREDKNEEIEKMAEPEMKAAVAIQFDEAMSEEEKQEVEKFSKTIDVKNPDHVMLYGAEAQKKVSDFADTILADVKNKDAGEVGDMLSNLVGELKTFESSTEVPKGIRGWFTNAKKQLVAVRVRFDNVSKNVDSIASALEDHQVQLLKDVSMLNHLYDMNLNYFKELGMYIAAGEKRLHELRENDLKEAVEKAKKSGSAVDAQEATDLEHALDRFEKKLHDLKLTRQISLQMAPQIRLLQNNNALLIERIQSTLVNTLPLWKNQMVLSLGLHHSKQAVGAQRAVTNMTNELLKKNAETLKMGTIETAKESERSIIDIETLVQTNQSLIDTMNEVLRIQQEGRQKRLEAEKTLLAMEAELKNRMLNA